MEVDVRVYADHIEVYYKGHLVESMERIHGAGEAHIDYRHIIGSLVRKPGAFARYRFREQMMLLVCWLWDEESFQGRCKGRSNNVPARWGELLMASISVLPNRPAIMMLLVSWFWRVTRWIGVRQTECSLVMEDRSIARVAAPVPE